MSESLPLSAVSVSSDESQPNRIVCFLVINKIRDLPEISITSVLKNSQEHVVVGYLKSEDIEGLPQDSRVQYLKLSEFLGDLSDLPLLHEQSRNYVSFDEEVFFQLVQVKWILLRKLLEVFDVVIYTDLDVIWLEDVAKDFLKTFESKEHMDVIVQDFSYTLSETKLCMGLFAARRSDFSANLIDRCSAIHASHVIETPRFSDDDAISMFYEKCDNPQKIARLPNQSYPVGNLINLFLPFSVLRGLRPRRPMIFHANFVVGQNRKIMLLRLIEFLYSRDFRKFLKFASAYLYVLRAYLERRRSKKIR
jgi:hypothetical protein